MTSHFNIQINIQRVTKRDTPARGMQGPTSERETTEVLKLAVTAATEEEAYAKAHKMLTANQPEPVPHLHRASCHGPIGELQCGFPANGPTI